MCKEKGRTVQRKGALCGKVPWAQQSRRAQTGRVDGMPEWRWTDSGKRVVMVLWGLEGMLTLS